MIYVQTNTASPIQKIIAALLGITMLTLVLIFSIVALPVIAVVGLIGFGYFYWKTRALRKAMTDAVQDHGVIEGEAVVIREPQEIKHLS
jgi:hypothetical protein